MLFTLGQLAIEFPEVSDLLGQKLEEAELKMPPRPPSQLAGGRSRPGSVNNGKTTGSIISVVSEMDLELSILIEWYYMFTMRYEHNCCTLFFASRKHT